MSFKQQFAVVLGLLCGAACAAAAAPFDAPQPAAAPAVETGFYGGVVLREGMQDRSGVSFGHVTSAWARFTPPTTADEANSRALLFGGYRWSNDLAVEAAFASAANYALAPAGARGVGLSLAVPADAPGPRAWNADVYTTYSFKKSVALYGRLGYLQDSSTTYAQAYLPGDARRARDGMNYGVGMRYDITPALGLRVEYARFGRFAGESVGGFLPESDQVQLGMQLRF